MTEPTDLVAEQLARTFDHIKSEIALIRQDVAHNSEVTGLRLNPLEKASEDYEKRLRVLQDSSTTFKVLASLATGGGLLSVISLLRELLK